jgi:uncharacterized membrane protein YfcA
MEYLEITLLFALAAFVYSSAGFGGGSSYLAILALFAVPFQEMRFIALLCNIVVTAGGTLVFYRNQQLLFSRIFPLVFFSIPAAYAGAVFKISQHTFFLVLACTLLAASVFLWIGSRTSRIAEEDAKNLSHFKSAVIGLGIGFLSGMVGIGGGIFLSPLLHLMKWDTSKKIAATASVFILLNSVAGVAGQLTHLPADFDVRLCILLILTVAVCGQAGSRIAVGLFKEATVRRVTALLVFAAGMEILVKHLSQHL